MNRQKKFYVRDIVQTLGVPRSTYYNWEKAGKVPKPRRDPMSRYRYWTKEDLERLRKLCAGGA